MADSEHTNEFGEIEAFKDTKYWFKRDLQTFKRSLFSTFNVCPFIFLAAIVLSALASLTYHSPAVNTISLLTLIFFPIFLLGYFMIHVMVTKGYDIDPYAGTHTNSPQYGNRFNVGYILHSDIPVRRKILFLLRFVLYILLIVGLLITVVAKFK